MALVWPLAVGMSVSPVLRDYGFLTRLAIRRSDCLLYGFVNTYTFVTMLNRREISLLIAIVLGAACVVSARAGDLHGFAWNTKADLSGYYMPSREIRSGKFVLDNFAIGDAASFRDFIAGKFKGQPYAPVM